MSTIKVDKLQGTSGSATAMTLSGANSTFNGVLTVPNTAIYTSDGGSVTQNLIDSVAKLTLAVRQSGTISESASSLNVSSVSDGSAGINTINSTTAFSAALAAVPTATIHDGSYNRGINIDDTSTSAFKTSCFTSSSGGLTDSDTGNAVVIHGDLA